MHINGLKLYSVSHNKSLLYMGITWLVHNSYIIIINPTPEPSSLSFSRHPQHLHVLWVTDPMYDFNSACQHNVSVRRRDLECVQETFFEEVSMHEPYSTQLLMKLQRSCLLIGLVGLH